MRCGCGCHTRSARRSARLGAASRAGLALAASVLLLGPARAQDGAQSPGMWQSLLETLNIRAKPGAVPDFVQASRPDPATLHFVPTTAPHPPRETPVRTKSDIEAVKAQLDGARARQLNPPAPAAKPPFAGVKRAGAKKPAAASPGDRVASTPRP